MGHCGTTSSIVHTCHFRLCGLFTAGHAALKDLLCFAGHAALKAHVRSSVLCWSCCFEGPFKI